MKTLYATLGVFLALFAAASVAYPGFFSLRVALNLFTDNAFLGVAAIGLTFVILSGGIDLSIGAMIGCSGILCATLLEKLHWSAVPAVLAVLTFGFCIGAMHGALIAVFRLPPFLVTLAGLFVCRGIALSISREALQVSDPTFTRISEMSVRLGKLGTVTAPAAVFVFAVGIAAYVLKYSSFGRRVYALGGSENSSSLMGLTVTRTKFWIYVLSGVCSAVGGLVFLLYTASGNAVAGTGLELDAIAAVVIGGATLTGGYGSAVGTMLGVLTLGTIQTIITFDGRLSSWWTKIFVGSLFLAFVLARRIIHKEPEKSFSP